MFKILAKVKDSPWKADNSSEDPTFRVLFDYSYFMLWIYFLDIICEFIYFGSGKLILNLNNISVISSETPCNDGNSRFTTVPLINNVVDIVFFIGLKEVIITIPMDFPTKEMR